MMTTVNDPCQQRKLHLMPGHQQMLCNPNNLTKTYTDIQAERVMVVGAWVYLGS
jgi:hypothetical protein